MGKIVYKYEARQAPSHPSDFNVFLPAGAKLLSVGFQDGSFVAWALVDATPEPSPDPAGTLLHIASTGQPLPADADKLVFVNRVEATDRYGQPLVFHAFRRK